MTALKKKKSLCELLGHRADPAPVPFSCFSAEKGQLSADFQGCDCNLLLSLKGSKPLGAVGSVMFPYHQLLDFLPLVEELPSPNLIVQNLL